MRAPTHSLFACFFCILLWSMALPKGVTSKPLVLLSAGIAFILGTLPDLDTRVPLRVIGHRSGFSHSFFTIVIVSLLAYLIFSNSPPLELIIVPATAGAIASHILLDTLTVSGCPLLWPLTRHRYSAHLCTYDNALVNFVISALSALGIAAYIVYT
ncbi:MAG: metal-dependent hydrolase [Halobacteriota archaeon]